LINHFFLEKPGPFDLVSFDRTDKISHMTKHFNPFSQKTHASDYGHYFNLFYYYVEKLKVQPCVYEYGSPVKKSTFANLEKIGAKKVFSCDLEKIIEKNNVVNVMEICYEYENCLVFFYRKESIISRLELNREDEDYDDIEEKDFAIYKCKVLYEKQENLEKIKACIDLEPQQQKHSNVFLLCTFEGMLSLQRFDIKLPQKEIDLQANYGKEAAIKFEKTISILNKNKNGLMLFSGDPGTGKSTFIKYITTKTNRKVIYLSSGSAEQLTNPDFLSFIMGQRNSILLLEDAEKVLRSRESTDNEAISNILNISDGILGDCLNIMVIATFNINRESIDSALVRKGRLLIEHHFNLLSVEDSNALLKNLGSKRKTDVPMTLADIYNEEENFHKEQEKKSKVGF
jgi:hypothetical protein